MEESQGKSSYMAHFKIIATQYISLLIFSKDGFYTERYIAFWMGISENEVVILKRFSFWRKQFQCETNKNCHLFSSIF